MGTINIRQAKDTGDIGALMDALRTSELWLDRSAAAEALGELKRPEAVLDLIRAFKDKYWQVRGSAIKALGEICGIKAPEPLIVALNDEEPEVRSAAALALGIIGDPAALAPLLARVGDESFESARCAPRKDARNAVEAIAARAPSEAAEKCRVFIQHNNRAIRQFAVKMAGITKDALAVEALIVALDDSHAVGDISISGGPHPGFFHFYPVRAEAAVALGLIGDTRGMESLVSMMLDFAREPEERKAAAQALGGIRDDRSVEALMEAVYHADMSSYAYDSLRKLGTPRAQALLPLASVVAALECPRDVDPSPIEAAAKLGDPRVVRALVHHLEVLASSLAGPYGSEDYGRGFGRVISNVGRILGILGTFNTNEARAALGKYDAILDPFKPVR